jgi:hypothetical protein
MRSLKFAAAICALAASLVSVPAAASTFSPAAPLPFELVNLRMTVDSCAFDPSTVFVVNTGTSIQVRLRDRQCFAPGTPTEVDVRLGAFPVGLYSVEVASLAGDIVTVRERLQFSVIPRAVITVFPPPPFPLTDYSGLWWDPRQPGRGVSIHQNASDSLFVVQFDYAFDTPALANGIPGSTRWTTIQGGRWETATRWSGTLYHTTFPPLVVEQGGGALIEFDVAAPAGTAPGLKWARIVTFGAAGNSSERYITRQPF